MASFNIIWNSKALSNETKLLMTRTSTCVWSVVFYAHIRCRHSSSEYVSHVAEYCQLPINQVVMNLQYLYTQMKQLHFIATGPMNQ